MLTDERQQYTHEYAMTAIPSSSHVERTVTLGEVNDGEKSEFANHPLSLGCSSMDLPQFPRQRWDGPDTHDKDD